MALVQERETAAETCRAWRGAGERVVFTNGVFDILHPGHTSYLAEARGLGDRLVVGVNGDESARRLEKGPGRPYNPVEDRMALLAALEAVDLVVPFDEDTPLELIRLLRPDVLVKGGDYNEVTIVGADEVRSWGGEVHAVALRPGYSTSDLVERIRAGDLSRGTD
ncbi:D-glycero-beta-D-manno-heptose 1-phosphate adenylyltransferase [Gemmatimonadota bacterium]